MPDFTPKEDRITLDRLTCPNQETEMREFVSGKPGTYYLSDINSGMMNIFEFVVAVDDRKVTIIKDQFGAVIPHSYLFEKPVGTIGKFFCYLSPGRAGEDQFAMMCFLQKKLTTEITAQAEIRRQDFLKKRKELVQEKDGEQAPPALTLATHNGVSVQHQTKSAARDIVLFAPQAFGVYSLDDGEHTCEIMYAKGSRGNTVTIIAIEPGHTLALAGAVCGTKIFAKTVTGVPIAVNAPNRDTLVAFQDFLIKRMNNMPSKKDRAA